MLERFHQRLAFTVLPKMLIEIIRRYLRVEAEGLDRVPRRGRVIIAPNHSGWIGIDAVLLGYLLHRETRRIPRILTLWKFFETFPALEPLAHKMGLKAAKTENGMELLRTNHMVVLFPEGESGSFKPSAEKYRLQPFHTGFVRMSVLTKSPIYPCIVIGAEETHINLAQLKWSRYLKKNILPLPLNVIPLPAKWRIRFLDPIDFSKSFDPEDTEDRAKMEEAAEYVRQRMQTALDGELEKRDYVYFGPLWGRTRPAKDWRDGR